MNFCYIDHVLTTRLNYMDRSALSITAPLIEKELGFNAAEMGMIF
ncbi:MFS transporter, partial [Salmonella enterica subsp. enterica serovar Heidelberg]